MSIKWWCPALNQCYFCHVLQPFNFPLTNLLRWWSVERVVNFSIANYLKAELIYVTDYCRGWMIFLIKMIIHYVFLSSTLSWQPVGVKLFQVTLSTVSWCGAFCHKLSSVEIISLGKLDKLSLFFRRIMSECKFLLMNWKAGQRRLNWVGVSSWRITTIHSILMIIKKFITVCFNFTCSNECSNLGYLGDKGVAKKPLLCCICSSWTTPVDIKVLRICKRCKCETTP